MRRHDRQVFKFDFYDITIEREAKSFAEESVLVVNLSGRGDKDLDTILQYGAGHESV